MHDLLNVGCRGQRAYCRPYPAVRACLLCSALCAGRKLTGPHAQALVGIAQEVDFDIKTSICEMLIRQDLEEDPASGSEAESLIYCPRVPSSAISTAPRLALMSSLPSFVARAGSSTTRSSGMPSRRTAARPSRQGTVLRAGRSTSRRAA